MTSPHSAFPSFSETTPRALTHAERSVLERLAPELDAKYQAQLPGLVVVGRCGCERCPTIFFQARTEGDREYDLASFTGRDSTGGLVAAGLLEKDGTLSQLAFFSIDGHEPWFIPETEPVEPFSMS